MSQLTIADLNQVLTADGADRLAISQRESGATRSLALSTLEAWIVETIMSYLTSSIEPLSDNHFLVRQALNGALEKFAASQLQDYIQFDVFKDVPTAVTTNDADKILISQETGGITETKTISADTLAAYIQAKIPTTTASYFPVAVQNFAPGTGETINIASTPAPNQKTIFVLIKPASLLSKITINFPTAPENNQDIVLRSNHAIRTVDLVPTGSYQINHKIYTLGANTAVRYKYQSSDLTWYSW